MFIMWRCITAELMSDIFPLHERHDGTNLQLLYGLQHKPTITSFSCKAAITSPVVKTNWFCCRFFVKILWKHAQYHEFKSVWKYDLIKLININQDASKSHFDRRFDYFKEICRFGFKPFWDRQAGNNVTIWSRHYFIKAAFVSMSRVLKKGLLFFITSESVNSE